MQSVISRSVQTSTMEYYLHPAQSVYVKDGLVTFRHYTKRNTIHYLTIDSRQLQNLNDLIHDIHLLKKMRNYPIGGGVWLTYEYHNIKLCNYERNRTFRFYIRSWEEYKRCAHRQVLSFVRYGERRRCACHEHDADNESRPIHRFGRRTSYLQRGRQILSRSSRNGGYENVKRSQSTVFSRRKGSNSRSYSPQRGGKHAMRISQQIKNDKEDGEITSDEFDNEEHGSECSIEEEESVPEQDTAE